MSSDDILDDGLVGPRGEQECVFSDLKTSESYLPENNRTAILLLDFQNEFAKEAGQLHDEVAVTMEATGMLRNTPKLVEYARKTNAMVIYSQVVMQSSEVLTSFSESQRVSNDGSITSHQVYSEQLGLFTENTWNCEIIHELEPKNDDTILRDRSNFSAFSGTKLLSILKSNNISHLFIAGFLTDVCVSKTSIDAVKFIPDMSTYIVSDCCAAKSLEAHNSVVENISKNSVHVVSCAQAKTLLAQCADCIKHRVLDGSDEWLMIEKIFTAAGVGENKNISCEELQSLIKVMPSSSSIFQIISDSLGGMGDRSISREDMHKILFERRARSGFFEKLPLFIIMVFMPILYTMSTRIPYIFVALEITVVRERKLWEYGIVIGVYQGSRALGNLLIATFGGKDAFKRLQIFLICCALSGWFFLALFERESDNTLFSFTPIGVQGEPGSDYRALFALFLIGLCETVVLLQGAVMKETATESPAGIVNEAVVGNRLSLQYSMVSTGSVLAFILGGWIYTNYGYTGICDLGILIQIGHLIGAISYLVLSKSNQKNVRGEELEGYDLIRSVIYQFQAASVIAKYSQGVVNGTENALRSEDPGMANAAIKAKADPVLNHALSEMFQCFFTKEKDDVASMEELLMSIEKASAKRSSKRPSVMAIGKRKLSKLILFLIKSNGDSCLTERDFVVFWAPRIYMSMFESSQDGRVSVVWPYMKAVVLSQGISSLAIGTFLSSVVLSYTERFEVNAAEVGVLLGIGQGLGAIVLLTKSFISIGGNPRPGIMRAIISRPLNVVLVIFVLSGSLILFSINNYVIAVMCQMTFSAMNDLSTSLLNELAGTSLPPDRFRYYQGLGQWMGRSAFMLTGILGPILFAVDASFPFLLFGALVFAWAVILWFLMYKHAERIQNSLAATINDDDSKGDKGVTSCLTKSGGFAPFIETGRTHWHELEQKYYSMNKESLEEDLNGWKKAHVDISLMEHRIRRIAAALEVEKDQRRALEDRLYARVSNQPKYII